MLYEAAAVTMRDTGLVLLPPTDLGINKDEPIFGQQCCTLTTDTVESTLRAKSIVTVRLGKQPEASEAPRRPLQ
jgi:hypothetical protein